MRKEILVIKMSGKIVPHMRALAPQIKELRKTYNIVVVHGGKEQLSSLMLHFGLKPVFKDGHRVTDRKTLELAEMAFGKIRTDIVAELACVGVPAVGLGGADAKFIHASIQSEMGFEGPIRRIDDEIIHELVEKYVIVVEPLGFDAKAKALVNVDADDLATMIARTLGAKMMILGEVDGLYDKNGAIISRITTKELKQLIHDGVIREGMIPKAESCMKANLPKVWFLKGTVENVLLRAISNEPIGTLIIGS